MIALLLGLLYYRRKNFTLADHAIFTIHVFVFVFFTLIVAMGLSGLKLLTGWSIFSFIKVFLVLYSFYYLFRAMHNFYKQSIPKTILKFILFLLGFTFVLILVILIFSIVAFLKL